MLHRQSLASLISCWRNFLFWDSQNAHQILRQSKSSGNSLLKPHHTDAFRVWISLKNGQGSGSFCGRAILEDIRFYVRRFLMAMGRRQEASRSSQILARFQNPCAWRVGLNPMKPLCLGTGDLLVPAERHPAPYSFKLLSAFVCHAAVFNSRKKPCSTNARPLLDKEAVLICIVSLSL